MEHNPAVGSTAVRAAYVVLRMVYVDVKKSPHALQVLLRVDGTGSNVEEHVHREHPANLIAVVLLPIASAQLHRNPADSMDRNVEERAREMQHAGKLMRDVSVW